jgi:hypothetical protein
MAALSFAAVKHCPAARRVLPGVPASCLPFTARSMVFASEVARIGRGLEARVVGAPMNVKARSAESPAMTSKADPLVLERCRLPWNEAGSRGPDVAESSTGGSAVLQRWQTVDRSNRHRETAFAPYDESMLRRRDVADEGVAPDAGRQGAGEG